MLRFPPFSLIKDCLSRIRQDQADLVLVCPYLASQSWYPVLLELATEIPLMLSPSPDLLVSPQGCVHPLCQSSSFRMIAWKLSGIASEGKEFRSRLSLSYWPDPAHRHSQHINRLGKLGVIGVAESVSIPFSVA